MTDKEKEFIKNLKALSESSGFTEEELSLLSNTFYENDNLLLTIRKFILQGELDQVEKSFIDNLTPDTIKIVRKQLLPEINPNAPYYNLRDMWTSINTNEKMIEDVYLDMKAQKIAIDYLEQQLNMLKGGTSFAIIKLIKLKELVYNDKKDAEKSFIELKARNLLLTHIDASIQQIRTIAIDKAKISDIDKLEKIRQMNSNQ